MTLPELTTALDALDVHLSLRLVVDAPRGVLTPDLRDALANHKTLLMQQLVRGLLWGELSQWRWGPTHDDPTPGIIIDRPDLARTPAARRASADDPYAIAERKAIQAEGNLCGLNTHSTNNGEDGGGVADTHTRPLGPTLR
jgi:hypothetical protein